MPRKPITLVARAMFPAQVDGRTVVVLPGARLPADHELVKGNEAHFDTAAGKLAAAPSPRRRRSQ